MIPEWLLMMGMTRSEREAYLERKRENDRSRRMFELVHRDHKQKVRR